MAEPSLTLTLSSEQWRPVVGWEDYYSVSNLGRVVRVKPGQSTQSGHVLAQLKIKVGYLRVHLSRPGRKHLRLIHHLVAEAFIGPRPNGLILNHISGDKADNRPENLEYVTPSENTQHMMRLGFHNPPRGERSGSARFTEVQVREIKRMLRGGARLRDVAEMFNTHITTISSIKCGKSWAHVA